LQDVSCIVCFGRDIYYKAQRLFYQQNLLEIGIRHIVKMMGIPACLWAFALIGKTLATNQMVLTCSTRNGEQGWGLEHGAMSLTTWRVKL